VAGPDSQIAAMAAEAAAAVEADRAAAEQLTLLPDERPGAALVEDGTRRRGAGRALNQMRDWLALQGFRQPEQVIAEMAGLASGAGDALDAAIERTQRIFAAATAHGDHRVWSPTEGWLRPADPYKPTPDEWRQTFMQVFTLQLRAAEAMLPYGLPKVTPEQVTQQQVTQIVVQGAPIAPAAVPGVVVDARPARRIAPPPRPWEVEQNQRLAGAGRDGSDAEIRTARATP